MLPPAQDKAAKSISTRPSGVALPSVCSRITPMPPAASASDTPCTGCARSPESHIASPMVKNTCVCTTSEARPGEMWPFMAMNISPNCPTPINSP